MKNNWYLKCIKKIYGLKQVDEYRMQEVNRIGNNAFLILLIAMGIELLITGFSMLLIATHLSLVFVTAVLMTLSFSMFLTLMGVIIYVASAVAKLHLDEVEVDSDQDYQMQVKKYRSSAIKVSIEFFIMFEILNVIFSLIAGKSILNQLMNPLLIVSYIILSIIMGVFIYIISKRKLNR